MAALSEADKRVLLGEDHREFERQRNLESGVTDKMLDERSAIDRLDTIATTAYFIAIVCGLIFISNWFSVATPYEPMMALAFGVITAIALAVGVGATRKRSAYARPA